MKKILFTVAFSALFMGLNAQNILVNREPGYASGFLSMDPVETPIIASADAFAITEEVALGELTIHGSHIMNGDPNIGISGLGVYILENNVVTPVGYPDQPGTCLVELPNIPLEKLTIENDEEATLPGDFKYITVSLTEANEGEQIILQPGIYWLIAAPRINNPFSDFPDVNLWHWTISSATAPIAPLFYDPSNAGGVGATDWTQIGTLIPGFPAFAWSMTDEEIQMGTIENISDNLIVYPNPVKDVLNINSKTADIEDIALYDLTGKELKVDFNGQTINVSKLPAGIYVLRVRTAKGVITKKIIKK